MHTPAAVAATAFPPPPTASGVGLTVNHRKVKATHNKFRRSNATYSWRPKGVVEEAWCTCPRAPPPPPPWAPHINFFPDGSAEHEAAGSLSYGTLRVQGNRLWRILFVLSIAQMITTGSTVTATASCREATSTIQYLCGKDSMDV